MEMFEGESFGACHKGEAEVEERTGVAGEEKASGVAGKGRGKVAMEN